MRHRRPHILAALILISAGPSGTRAGTLRGFDPALDHHPSAPVSTLESAPAVTGHITLDGAALGRTYLFKAVVESTDSADMTLGSASDPVAITLKVEDDFLTARRVGAAESAPPLGRFPARPGSGGLEVDVSAAPELTIDDVVLRSPVRAPLAGLRQEPGLLTWAQEMRFEPPPPEHRRKTSAKPPEPVTVGVRYWFTRAPDSSFVPRPYPAAEARRAGFFPAATPGGDAVTRWHPDRPVPVLLHPTIPPAYRPAIRDAALAWNQAFAASAGQARVVVSEGRDQAVLPGADGVLLIYWLASNPGGNMDATEGMATTAADPRTGEMVSAHILINAETVLGEPVDAGAGEVEVLVQEAPSGRRFRPKVHLELPGGHPIRINSRPCGSHRLRRRPPARPDAAELERSRRRIRDVVIHEMGHALGLRHNFKGSADLAHHRPGEITSSVMDYLTDDTTPAAPGAYDEAAIGYGYAGRLVESMGDLAYATDEDKGVDPDANEYDSGDPLVFYLEALRTLRRQGGGGLPAFSEAVKDTLEHLRRFVNNSAPERSERAFEALVKSMERPGTGTKSAAERRAAKRVLTAAGPEAKDADEEPVPYPSLTAEQAARIGLKPDHPARKSPPAP